MEPGPSAGTPARPPDPLASEPVSSGSSDDSGGGGSFPARAGSASGDPGSLLPFALLGAGFMILGVVAWHPLPAGVWHDDGVYMLLGRSLARGHGLVYEGVPGAPAAVKFPPGYPAFLALLWGVFRTLARTTAAAEIANLAAMAGAAAVFTWWLRRGLGWSTRAALVVGALAWVSADVWRFALVPLSEPLFLLAATASLATAVQAARTRRRSTAALAGLALAVTVLLRTAGVTVVVAVVGGLLLRRRRVLAAWAAVPPLAVFATWSAWAGARAHTIPPALRDILGPYGSWFTGRLGAGFAGLAPGLPAHLREIGIRLAGMALPGLPGRLTPFLCVPVAALVSAGLWSLRRKAPELALLVVSYLGMLAVWPYVDSRLLAPVVPFAVVAAVAGAVPAAGVTWHRTGWWRRSLMALTAFWLGAYLVGTAGRFASGWPARAYEIRAVRLRDAVQALSSSDGEIGVVGAPEFWAALHLHGGWATAPSALFQPGQEPVWGTPQSQLRLWMAAGVDHVLLEQGGRIHGDALDLLEQTCPGSVWILRRLESQMLVRLTWDEACKRTVEGG